MGIESIASGLRSLLHPLTRFLARSASFVLFAMMCLTMADVIMRKYTNNSILGSVELTELMMVVLVFFSLAYTEMLDGHIKVDLLAAKLSEKTQVLLDIFTQFLGSGLFGFIAWSSFRYALSMQAGGEVTQDLWIPKYPFIYLAAFGSFLLSLALFFKFLDSLSKRSDA